MRRADITDALRDADGKVFAETEITGDGVDLPLFDTLPTGECRIRTEMKGAVPYTLNFE